MPLVVSHVDVGDDGRYVVRRHDDGLLVTHEGLCGPDDVLAWLPRGSVAVLGFGGPKAKSIRRFAKRYSVEVIVPHGAPGSPGDRQSPPPAPTGDEQRWAAVEELLRAAHLSHSRFRVALYQVQARQSADRRAARRVPASVVFSILIGLALIRAVTPDPNRGLPLVAIAALVACVVYAIPPLLISGLRRLTAPDFLAPKGSRLDHALHIGLWIVSVASVYAVGWALSVGHIDMPLPQVPKIEELNAIGWQRLLPTTPGRTAPAWGILIQFGAMLGASLAMLQVLVYGSRLGLWNWRAQSDLITGVAAPLVEALDELHRDDLTWAGLEHGGGHVSGSEQDLRALPRVVILLQQAADNIESALPATFRLSGDSGRAGLQLHATSVACRLRELAGRCAQAGATTRSEVKQEIAEFVATLLSEHYGELPTTPPAPPSVRWVPSRRSLAVAAAMAVGLAVTHSVDALRDNPAIELARVFFVPLLALRGRPAGKSAVAPEESDGSEHDPQSEGPEHGRP